MKSVTGLLPLLAMICASPFAALSPEIDRGTPCRRRRGKSDQEKRRQKWRRPLCRRP